MAASTACSRRDTGTLGGTGIAVADRHDLIPAMPCQRNSCFLDEREPPHWAKIADRVFPFNALVARPVGKQEIAKTPKVVLAMKSEWDRLRSKNVWEEGCVRDWHEDAKEAKDSGEEVNFGYLFGIFVDQNSELPPEHPSCKFKG